VGAGNIVLFSLFSAGSGALIALGMVQAISGRFIFSRFAPRGSSWTAGAIKLSGWTWAICGLSGLCMAVLGALEFGGIIPMYWVGSPWGIITANPWPLVWMATLLFQVLIDRHQKKRLKG